MDHEIFSSQCESRVVQFNKFYGNNFIMLRSVFEDFNEVTDHLDKFWFLKAQITHFKTNFCGEVSLNSFGGEAGVQYKQHCS